ncbi:putative beta-1,3-galactosyltransferase 2 [Morus notabilis]|uniref:Hexosyltransferase n=1 Tax=Morus notabilis TaxID=981085 RepID=W9QQK2_9ROSA|nr:probable beta-1,3-galactosyltransferase 2 [Morus notabilis]EXB50426.1 putative beta-1,3-galactosyltransferase 2 [Morus notabilis]
MSVKSKGAGDIARTRRNVLSRNWTLFLCFVCFYAGVFFTNRMWMVPEARNIPRTSETVNKRLKLKSEACSTEVVRKHTSNDSLQEVFNTEHAMQMLNKTVSDLEMKLQAAKAVRESVHSSNPVSGNSKTVESTSKRKYFIVIGISTAFSSRKRRDSVRMTWMPQGEKRKKLEEEKGIVIRFVIGHSSTSGGILDRAVEEEEIMHKDFLRLDHVEGYMELAAKTKTYFSTAVALWDAQFYVKVDDDVHVNLATLGVTLSRLRMKPRVYIGCMKSGPVLARKGVRYHEPEYWKFGTAGNKYFRHATGQLYAVSKELATYISINQHVLHKYANEDVSVGSWFIGLDVEHVDDRRLCCGTPPDCEWKAQAGNMCVASFDWRCSGICSSVERMAEVHRRCSEDENTLWSESF